MTDLIFPAALTATVTYPVLMKPMYRTLVAQSASGKTQRAALWSTARRVFTLTWEFMRDDVAHNEWKSGLAFFLACQGRFNTFLFTHPDDSAVTGQIIGSGDGSATQFQLIRTLNETWNEVINAPNLVSAIKVNGVSQGGWSVNSDTGVVTLASPPANGTSVTADFTYYYRCTLLNDEDEFERFGQALWEKKVLEFITEK